MNKKQLLQHIQKEVYCRIGVSKIHGVGVIAVRDIPKGKNPFLHTYEGPGIKISYKELEGLNAGVRKIIDDLLVHEEESVIIPSKGLNILDVSFYMNHTDSNPNIITYDDGETFVALRDIQKGEELIYTYNQFDQKLL